MGTRIIVCGLNGTGKSTLGKALAGRLHAHFIDNEDLYFPKADPNDPYASPRTREEVEKLLARELEAHENTVFAAVKGDYGEAVSSSFQLAVLISVPREIRIQRIRNRSFQKFGARMLEGGDLYEREERFFAHASARSEEFVEAWVRGLTCPVLRIDGTKPIEENINGIVERVYAQMGEDEPLT